MVVALLQCSSIAQRGFYFNGYQLLNCEFLLRFRPGREGGGWDGNKSGGFTRNWNGSSRIAQWKPPVKAAIDTMVLALLLPITLPAWQPISCSCICRNMLMVPICVDKPLVNNKFTIIARSHIKVRHLGWRYSEFLLWQKCWELLSH